MDKNHNPLTEFVSLYLKNQTSFDKMDVEKAIFLYRTLHKGWIIDCSAEKAGFVFALPYKEITRVVYDFEESNKTIGSDKITGFAEKVSLGLEKDGGFDSNAINAHEKFLEHVLLAKVQKTFILKSARQADSIANKAEKQAKKAKKMSSGMMTNYVTILGIFATIIITVFGGLNLISSAVQMIVAKRNLVYLLFVVSFLMFCLSTLVTLLTDWIKSLNMMNNDEDVCEESCLPWYKKTCGWISRIWKKTPKTPLVFGCLSLALAICVETHNYNKPSSQQADDFPSQVKSNKASK